MEGARAGLARPLSAPCGSGWLGGGGGAGLPPLHPSLTACRRGLGGGSCHGDRRRPSLSLGSPGEGARA